MGRARDLVIDVWSALSHKAPMRDDARARLEGWTPKSWLGEEHRRRLTAYTILDAYDNNVAREFLDTDDEDDRDSRREYGDAALIVDSVLAALLGEEQEIVVPGAEAYDPQLEAPEEPPEGADDETMERYRDELEEYEQARAENEQARALADRQEFLRAWGDLEHLPLRLIDGERNAVGLGDGVYLLGWSTEKQRPTCAVMSPGFYFPVLPDSLDAYDYPRKVHFAWEIPGEQYADGKIRVRRLTYELTRLAPTYDEDVLEAARSAEDVEAAEILPEDATWKAFPDGSRRLVRRYPWAPDVDSEWTCTFTDATWILDDLNDARDVDAFGMDRASIATDPETGERMLDYDLRIDFVPVVHEPNTPAGGDHYGQSSLAKVLQLLDDLASADTDAQASAATTGSPITWSSTKGSSRGGDRDNVLTGQRGKVREVKPGTHWELGEGGQAGAIDTSPNLAATREYVDHLRDRLSVNSRLPGVILGTVKPSEAPSGFAMLLGFGPLNAMIRQMRLVRSVKHPLLLKMVQRLYQANGALPAGPTPRAEIALGNYLPQDRAGTLALVKDAREANLISEETAVAMLVEVGFPIEDAAEEIARIHSRDFEGANRLADATGDGEAVRDYLGLEPTPENAGVPQVVLAPPIAGGTGVGETNPTDSGAR